MTVPPNLLEGFLNDSRGSETDVFGWIYVFYVGYIDEVDYETIFHTVTILVNIIIIREVLEKIFLLKKELSIADSPYKRLN